MERKRKSRAKGPTSGGHKKGGRPRRTPPPDGTGLEERYLRSVKASGVVLELRLRDGERIAGTVTQFDADTITVMRSSRSEMVLRKTDIGYVEETAERPEMLDTP